MKRKFNYLRVLPVLFAAGGLVLAGCTDGDYDLGDLDKTIAIGSGTLELPVNNSIKNILLDDILDLGDSETVTIDEQGFYRFKQSSSINDVNDIRVEKISVATASDPAPYYVDLAGLDIPRIEVPAGLPDAVVDAAIDAAFETAWGEIPAELVSEGRISLFTYETALDKDVKWLNKVTTDTNGNNSSLLIRLSLSPNVAKVVTQVSEMTIKLPTFLGLTITDDRGNTYTPDAEGFITMRNVPSNGINLKLTISELRNFTNAQPNTTDYLAIVNQTILMQGEAYTKMTIKRDFDINKEQMKNVLKTDGVSDAKLEAITTINTIVISAAEGQFCPDIDIADSRVDLDDLPDFLTDEKVVVDLYNPQIILTADSKLPLKGFVNAKLVAKKNDGTVMKTIALPEFVIENGKNKICISRRNEDIPAGVTQTIIVPNLSEIINKVPDFIELQIEARADDANLYTINLGQSYSLTDINYDIQAPLAFGKDARIVYNEFEDGWAEDMPEEIDLEKGAYIEVTGIIESNVPAFLTISAKAVDVNKKEIDNVTVDIDKVITASPDGKTFTETPLTIIIKEKDGLKGGLKQVDGIHYSIQADPTYGGTSIEGKPLNANENKLSFKNVKIIVHGRVIADLN